MTVYFIVVDVGLSPTIAVRWVICCIFVCYCYLSTQDRAIADYYADRFSP